MTILSCQVQWSLSLAVVENGVSMTLGEGDQDTLSGRPEPYLEEAVNGGRVAVLGRKVKRSVVRVVLLIDVGTGGPLADEHLDDLQVPLPGREVEWTGARAVWNGGGRPTAQQ